MVYMTDSARRASNSCDASLATKKLIASFAGTGFVAEREGDALNIYLMSGDNIQTGTNDSARAPMTPQRLQDLIVARRAGGAK